MSVAVAAAGLGQLPSAAAAQTMSRGVVGGVPLTPSIGAGLRSPVPGAYPLLAPGLMPGIRLLRSLPAAPAAAPTPLPAALVPSAYAQAAPSTVTGSPFASILSPDAGAGLGEKSAALGALYENAPAAVREPLEVLGRSEASAAEPEILAIGEKIARGITGDEGLRLVPWEPLWEGDRPAWRLVKEGGNLRVQYVPEDLRHADKKAIMAHLMQEIFRAVYSRPELIEPELQSNGLFRALYDTVETGRVVNKGLKERPGLAEDFEAFNRESYPGGDAEARRLKALPSYLRFLEEVLYEGRLGLETSRIDDPRVLDALKKTRSSRVKSAEASPEEAYKLAREIWPELQRLYAESEDAETSQELFEEMGQEGKLGADKDQNDAAGRGQLKLDDLDERQRERVQKEIEKQLEDMTPEQRENLRGRIRERLERRERSFGQSMGVSQGGPETGRPEAADIESASKEIAEKADGIREETPESRGSQDPGGKSGGGGPASGEPDGDEGLGAMLKAWSRQKNPGKSGATGEAGDSHGRAGEGELDPSGTQGTSDSMGGVEDKIERIKSGGLEAGQRSRLDRYLAPVGGMIDTLAYKIRRHLKASALGRDMTGLYEGDVDEDALPYYKAKIGIMKEELLPGRPKSRITFLLDLSGSMGRIDRGGAMDHATRALLMALKAFKLAFKNGPGVEVRVVAYNENPQLPIIGDYMPVKDLSDAVLYTAMARIMGIQEACAGNNCGVRMLDQAVADIRGDMKSHPDTTYALLHVGDGDPGADIATEIRAIYDDPANAKIRFASLATGRDGRDMYEKYKPYSFWARELSDLGARWAEIVEATFKKARRGA